MAFRLGPDKSGKRLRVGVSALCALVGVLSFAADPPDAAVNPQSGLVEVVDSVFANRGVHIRHTTVLGSGRLSSELLTNSSAKDTDARVVIAPNGDTWVTWCRGTSPPQILVMTRDYATLTWSAEQVISDRSEASRRPRIVHDGTQAWIAYEVDSGGGTSIDVAGGGDYPAPWPEGAPVAATTYTGSRDLTMTAETGHLWVTWIDTNATVGWVAYDYVSRTWSWPEYESYANDSVSAARDRIRNEILAK